MAAVISRLRTRTLPATLFAAAVPCICTATLHAQTTYQPSADAPAPLPVPLHEGVSDVGPLSTSFLVQSPDLRVATDFEKVYRVPGDDKHLMRVDGALAAVFPESKYVATRKGVYTDIPAGTVWTIGIPTGPINPPKAGITRNVSNNSPVSLGVSSNSLGEKELSPRFALTPAGNRGQPIALSLSERLTDQVEPESVTKPAYEAENQISPGAEHAKTSTDNGRPASYDLSSEFYRQVRLREITERYRPSAD